MTAPPFVQRSILGQSWTWRDGTGPAGDSDDLVARLLISRGCLPELVEQWRTPTIRNFMPDPSIFRDMDAAAARLADAVESAEKTVIFGDYDVDGATSAALLIRVLAAAGLEAGYYIPDRLMEGYGPSGTALKGLAEDGARLVVTVDCGAQAFEALEMARAAGLDVIVVDHHKCATKLPPALALVNPNRLDEGEGAAHGQLAAVGVAWLLAAALVRELKARGHFDGRDPPDILALLDLVALGTVADVAPLTGLNRAFVAQGLKVMASRRNTGLDALFAASRLHRAPLASDLGFALGPRINAGGRVGKSDLGVRLLTTSDPDEARKIAQELDRLNEERRMIEGAVLAEAERLAERQANRATVIVAGKGWHPGVIGIVAGRIKERHAKPAIVIAVDSVGTGKGSGRSISGVDLGAAVLAAKDHGLLIAGGGHAMAAGLTVAEERIEALGDFLEDRLAQAVSAASGARALMLDALVAPRGVNPLLVDTMEAAGPYGMGWPAPRLAAGPARIVRADVVGKDHVRAILAGDDGASLKAVAFRHAGSALGQALLAAPRDRRLWVAGRAKTDDWGGRQSAELHLDDAAWTE